MWIILVWTIPDYILPVMREDGKTMLFDAREAAECYAGKEVVDNYKIVEVYGDVWVKQG